MGEQDKELDTSIGKNFLCKPLELRPEEQPLKDWERVVEIVRRELKGLGQRAHELEEIRGTLLTNFGETRHNTYGFVIQDKGSTMQMLLDVLKRLTKEEK